MGSSLLVAALVVVGAPSPEANAARMCDPVTIEDLFPEPVKPPSSSPTTTVPGNGESSTPSSTPETTTTPVPSTTVTTVPEATTVATTTPGTDPAPAEPRPSSGCAPFSYEMVWPLAGKGQIMSGFGADRDGGERHHQGNDITAPKLTPVVAVADGVVLTVKQEVGTEDCCYLALRHNDGWQSYYVHLNNDRWGTDDGMGVGVRADLVEGKEVLAGEVIGWVGDSGNAEETVVHLHFELRTPGGVPVDPRPSLIAAQKTAVFPETDPSWPYADDDGLATEWLAADMLTRGLFLPCDEAMVNFCPESVASPDLGPQIVRQITGRTPPELQGSYRQAYSSDATRPSHTLEEVLGCAPISECLDFGVPESELARLAVWVRLDEAVTSALPVAPAFENNPAVSLPSPESAETWLRKDGLRGECNPALDGTELVTRAETLVLLTAWLQGSNPDPCIVAGQRTR
jgi:hypothetical protein